MKNRNQGSGIRDQKQGSGERGSISPERSELRRRRYAGCLLTACIKTTLLACSLIPNPRSLSAAVPLTWTVETSRATPAQFEAYRGETLTLEATLQSNGKPLELSGIAALYWQTNGMGSAYWEATAAVNSNRLSAVWTPEMDVGARVYNCFLGQPGKIYRAAFQLRLRPSPGATPNVLPLPTPVIDFATVEVLHPPYYTKADADGLLEDKADKTNTYTKAEVDGLIDEAGKVKSVNGKDGEVVLTAADVHALPDTYTPPPAPVQSVNGKTGAVTLGAGDIGAIVNGVNTNGEIVLRSPVGFAGNMDMKITPSRISRSGVSFGSFPFDWIIHGSQNLNEYLRDNYLLQEEASDKYVPTTRKVNGQPLTGDITIEAMPNNGVMLTDGALKTKGGTEITAGNVGAASSEDVQTLNLGYQRLYSFSTGATNANISVTNYPPTAAEAEGRTHYDPNDPDLDFSTVPASMRLDEKRDGEKRTVVDTRDWPVWYFGCKLPRILAAAQEYAHTAYTNALAHLSAWADRTARGLENPAGESTLVIDVPNIWLMTDQTFEKHVSGSSSCWVIRSKNAAISPNVTTNGFLELTDAFGTPYIRFNKTEATFADPPASGIYHDDQEGEWIITYETTTKPKGGANLALQGSETYPGKAILKEEGDELCPAVITWTGSSGHWLMHAKPKQIAGADPDKMIFGAVVEVEGQDYIEYLKPVSFSHLVMPNGKKIAPDVPASASVGTIVNWKVVQ